MDGGQGSGILLFESWIMIWTTVQPEKMMVVRGMLTTPKDFQARRMKLNETATIYLMLHARRRQLMALLCTVTSIGTPISMEEPIANAWSERSMEFMSASTCQISTIPDLEKVTTNHPWKRVWEVTWLTGTKILSSYRSLVRTEKKNWNLSINKTKFSIAWLSAPDPTGSSRISRR